MVESERTSRRLALVGIVGPVIWWALVIVNGAITPGYSHRSDLISELGAVGAPYATVQTVNFVVLGSSILEFALGVHLWFGDRGRPRVSTVLVGIFGVFVILAGVFPADVAAPDSTTTFRHNLVSTIAFVAGIAGASLLTRRTGMDDRWPSYPRELLWTVLIVVVTFVAFMYSLATDSAVVGLTQRGFIGVLSLWVVLQSYRLYGVGGSAVRPETDRSRPISTDL